MTDTADNLQDTILAAVILTLSSYDITVRGDGEVRSEITVTQVEHDTYEASVPTIGRVLLDDLLDEQGRLLYSKNGVHVSLKGFQDDQLLFEIVRND